MSSKNGLAEKQDYIEQFRKSIFSAYEGIEAAAKIYVKAIDEDPSYIDKFQEAFIDDISPSAWSQLEAVGRKSLHAKLLMGSGGIHAAKIKRLPFSLQQKILNGDKFEFLTAKNDILKLDLRTATIEQAKQMFEKNHIRSISEQKAWRESNIFSQKSEQVHHYMPYEIRRNGVYFKENTILTKDEVKRLAMQIL